MNDTPTWVEMMREKAQGLTDAAFWLEAAKELERYKRLEALLRDRSDVVDVPDTYNEVMANAEMRALQDWENGE